ncbi:hypothetical protein CYQ88_00935 [Hydrogenovibrio sp. SC-1]|uniref:Wzz/FepE/Etk N-terminal domain-containing protein n=1 Tax=Hydrogenovibrio sp. SC-1 TaxID=2065820 RepID=UPI000C7E4108|nr:Wzz/FepE/Etk N-terminal domain-containing protein [Hydrogenovibrio sp. SC-1]PLA75562.1 hypothetical protein CYQ88_00935 [Hydrogenovibrio sp. SC-1]
MSAPSKQTSQEPIYPESYNDDEIDLAKLWAVLYKCKKLILGLAVSLAVVVAAYSLTIPNKYTVSVLLAPASSEGSSGLASQYGGLASLAGISLPSGEASPIQTALAVMQSRKFLREFIAENQLKKELFSKSWDVDRSQWKLNSSLMDSLKHWVGLSRPSYNVIDKPGLGEPSDWSAVQKLSKMLSIVQDNKNEMVTVSIEWIDAVQAQKWVTAFINRINTQIRLEQIEDSQKTIEYLQEQLKDTKLVEIRMAAYNLIENNIKNMTLAKTQKDYVFKIIDPAVIPDIKSGPNRFVMVVVAFVFGGILGVFISLIKGRRDSNAKMILEKDC